LLPKLDLRFKRRTTYDKFFQRNKPNIQVERNSIGAQYAKEINEMIEFSEKNGCKIGKEKKPEITEPV